MAFGAVILKTGRAGPLPAASALIAACARQVTSVVERAEGTLGFLPDFGHSFIFPFLLGITVLGSVSWFGSKARLLRD